MTTAQSQDENSREQPKFRYCSSRWCSDDPRYHAIGRSDFPIYLCPYEMVRAQCGLHYWSVFEMRRKSRTALAVARLSSASENCRSTVCAAETSDSTATRQIPTTRSLFFTVAQRNVRTVIQKVLCLAPCTNMERHLLSITVLLSTKLWTGN